MRRRLSVFLLLAGLVCTGLFAVAPAHAQLLPKALQPEQEEPDPEAWEPPPITDLPADWWDAFQVEDTAEQNRRIDSFVAQLRDRIDGLAPLPQQRARASIENLTGLVQLLKVIAQEPAGEQFEPVPTQDSYTLQGMLALRGLYRDLDEERAGIHLQVDQADRQLGFLQARRDRLLRSYNAQPVESPSRIQAGLDRIAARLEYELVATRRARLEARLTAVDERERLVAEQLDYAERHLEIGDITPEAVEAAVAAARDAVAESEQRVAALQSQLLDVLAAEEASTSLELLRHQQLRGAEAAKALARVEEALAESEANWFRLRTDSLDDDFDLRASVAGARELSERVLQRLDDWSTASQNTLVSSPGDDSANTLANYDIARSVARETLDIVERIRDRSDDLLRVQEILSRDVVALQSGFRKAWSRLKLALGAVADRVTAVADYHLFSLGDTPVTPGGVLKMLLIVVLAWLLSWVARYLIAHASAGGEQFSHSPVAYTLGRILHYVIITVGLFAAFGSIGFDFTSFALIAGALSVGIGFGLQAVVNNFVSGLILLFEGSLRVGDYIELDSPSGGLAGVVREINTRATVVNSNDNVDVVVPNSELVTTKLTNWTLRESIARMRIPFGVAYGSEKEQVREIALAAAGDVEFVLTNMPGRRPQVRLYKFGDNALEFQALLWVSRAGVRRPHRIRCDYLWALETRLREAGVEIPFPQRDLHFRSDFRNPPDEAPVVVAPPEPDESDTDDGTGR